MTTTTADNPEAAEAAALLAGATFDLLAQPLDEPCPEYRRQLSMLVIHSRADFRLRAQARALAFETLADLQEQSPQSRDRLSKASRIYERERIKR
jgi:hypothetical protein